jgi:hypothetical protein
MAGQSPCRWTAMRCREQDFQRFLGVDGEDAAAQARWDERIRRAYLNYQKQHPTNHQ